MKGVDNNRISSRNNNDNDESDKRDSAQLHANGLPKVYPITEINCR